MNSTLRFAQSVFVVFASLVPLTSANAQGGPSIFPAPVYGGSPQDLTSCELALGDIDGNGLLDAVVGVRHPFGSGRMLVQRGNAYGGFGPPTLYSNLGVFDTPSSVAVGDLTGDGFGDVAISTFLFGTGYVSSVYPGSSQGTLGTPTHYPGRGDLAIGDLTGDGRQDLVVLEIAQICVRAGNAQGTLDAPICHALTGSSYVSVAIGDVDDDGRMDVVATSSTDVCVLRGNAQGTLDPPACRATGGSDPAHLALGDVTGDGLDDAILVDQGMTDVCVFPGTAQGPLDPSTCYDTGFLGIWSIAVGDASEDSLPDVVVGGYDQSQDEGILRVLKGNPAGTLESPVPCVPGRIRPRSIAFADLDADGRLEVLVASHISNDVLVLEGDGQGGLETADVYFTDAYGQIALGDVSGDDRLDVVASGPSDDSVCVLKGNPQGTLDAPECHPAGGDAPGPVALGELTGDTFTDVVVGTNGGVCVLEGNAQGSLDGPVCYAVGTGDLAVGDANGDTLLDVVVSTSGGLCVLEGNAQGTLDPPVCVPAPQGKLALADVTGDGRLDAVVAHAASGASEVCVLAGNVQGSFDPPICTPAGGPGASDIAVGDVDGDGRADVVVTNVNGSGGGEMCILLGTAQGTLGPAACDFDDVVRGIDIGDVDGDGMVDIVGGGFTFVSGGISGAAGGIYVGVREGNGQPTAGAFRFYVSPASYTPGLVLGDVDRDGRLDAVVPGVAVLENQLESLGTVSCLGTSACPCGNAGTGARGCENSSSTGGARLTGDGTPSLAEDTVRLFATGERPSALTIFLQGDTAIPATNFGDGLRCAGGALKRLYVKNASQGAASAPLPADPSISVRSAAAGDPLSAGDVRVYQTYYRDPAPSFCPAPTGNTFNSSNALTLTWGQ